MVSLFKPNKYHKIGAVTLIILMVIIFNQAIQNRTYTVEMQEGKYIVNRRNFEDQYDSLNKIIEENNRLNLNKCNSHDLGLIKFPYSIYEEERYSISNCLSSNNNYLLVRFSPYKVVRRYRKKISGESNAYLQNLGTYQDIALFKKNQVNTRAQLREIFWGSNIISN